jgi:hypothetical protein
VSSEKIKVEEREDLVRDSYSGAVLNTDLVSVHAYKARKNSINKMKAMENKIFDMEHDIKDIKFLLQRLIKEKE